MLTSIIDSATSLCAAEGATVYIVDSTKDIIWRAQSSSSDKSVVVPAGCGLVTDVAETQTLVCLDDVTADSRFDPQVDVVATRSGKKLVARNLLCIPLMQGNCTQAVGVLQVFNSQSGTFSQTDQMLMKMLADQAAVSIRNAMMYQEMSAAQHHTRDFTNLALDLSATTSKSQVMMKLLEGGKQMLHAENIYLYVLDGDSDKVMVRFDESGKSKKVHKTSAVSRVLLTGSTINLMERRAAIREEMSVGESSETAEKAEVIGGSSKHVSVNVLAAPLMEKTGIFGAFEAVNGSSMYGAADEELIKELCNLATRVLRGYSLNSDVEEKMTASEKGKEKDAKPQQ
jgi:transcriptional regulator with GAF, ATPase, and Fis domain